MNLEKTLKNIIFVNMKGFFGFGLGVFICLFAAIIAYDYLKLGYEPNENIEISGEYILSDKSEIFTFTNDSLYIDCYNSGCGIDAYKLSKSNQKENTWFGKRIDLETDSTIIDTIEIKKVNDSNCLKVSINGDKYFLKKIQ